MNKPTYLLLRPLLLEWSIQSGQTADSILSALANNVLTNFLSLATFRCQDNFVTPNIFLRNLHQVLLHGALQDKLEAYQATVYWKVWREELIDYCCAVQIRPPAMLTGGGSRLYWLTHPALAPPMREPTPVEISRLAGERAGRMARDFALADLRPAIQFDMLPKRPPKSLSHAPGTSPYWASHGTRSKMIAQDSSATNDDNEPKNISYIDAHAQSAALAPDKAETCYLAEVITDKTVRSSSKPDLPNSKLKKWYEKRVQDLPAGSKPPSREQDAKDIETSFPEHSVTRKRMRAARKAYTPETWQRGGRPESGQKILLPDLPY